MEFAAIERWKGESVPPTAEPTLTHCRFDGILVQRGQHIVISRGVVVERAIQSNKAFMPALVASVTLVIWFEHFADGFCRWLPWAVRTAHPIVNEFAVFSFSRGDQCERFHHASLAAVFRVLRIDDEFLF